jgi:hypothetical protein
MRPESLHNELFLNYQDEPHAEREELPRVAAPIRAETLLCC